MIWLTGYLADKVRVPIAVWKFITAMFYIMIDNHIFTRDYEGLQGALYSHSTVNGSSPCR